MNLCILIPSFNPTVALLTLLHDLYDSKNEILIVDDGSFAAESLGILESARQTYPRVIIISHPRNLGKGNALKTGFSKILSAFPSSVDVITVDGDGQHLPEDIMKIHKALETRRDGLIIGTRSFPKNTPWKSLIGNRFTSWLLTIFFKLKLQDSQSGLRGIPAFLVPIINNIPGKRYEYETACILFFLKKKIPIYQVPISTVYVDQNKGSHFKPFSDSAKILRTLLRNINQP
jgi:glycosyltransferase involved in cell wall biosynthesis